jgi:hypothetical protein
MKHAQFSLLFFLGLMICASPTGMKDFSDLDQNLPILLGHRSLITHSVFFPLVVYFFIERKKNRENVNLLIFLSGLFLGMGIHLVADLFPGRWGPNSFIKIPGNISIGYFSLPWIAFNAIISIYFAHRIIKKIPFKYLHEKTFIAISLFIGFFYSLNERNNQLFIFVTFLILFISIFILKKKRPNYF